MSDQSSSFDPAAPAFGPAAATPTATDDPRAVNATAGPAPLPTARFLLGHPGSFRVSYEINPWMDLHCPVDRTAAAAEWQALVALYRDLGAALDVIGPVEAQPDLVYVANAGLVQGKRVYVSRFRHPERQGEEPIFARWFAEHGYEIVRPPAGLTFEGAAEVRLADDCFFGGWGIRTDRRIHDWLAAELARPVIDLELVDPRFYHLDTCLNVLPDGLILYYPAAFARAARAKIRARAADAIELTDLEGAAFVANSIVIGRTVVLGWVNERLTEELARRNLHVRVTPVGEFRKGGGSVACLTLPLAGAWTGAGGNAWSEPLSSSSQTASSAA